MYFISGIFIILLGLIIFTIVRTKEFKYRLLFWLNIIFLFISVVPLIIGYAFGEGPPNVEVICWLLLINVGIIIITCFSIIFSKKANRNDKQMSIAAILFLLAATGIGFWLEEALGTTTLFKEKIVGEYYLNIYRNNDSRMQYSNITIENYLTIKRSLNSGADPWDIPEEVKLISFRDSILEFSLTTSGMEIFIKKDVRFQHVNTPVNGIRLVHLRGRQGAIDESGRIVIPLGEYDLLCDNYSGLMLAYRNGKAGYINRNNQVVIPFIFDGGGNFLSDSTTVKINKKAYWINKKGEITSRAAHYDD